MMIEILLAASLLSVSTPSDPVLEEISRLEQRRDPKCYATAGRLEDFMYGTPLSEEARAQKIRLQEDFVRSVWRRASDQARVRNSRTISINDLRPLLQTTVSFAEKPDGSWEISHESDRGKTAVRVSADDLRQYSSVAYSLRTILAVQQKSLFEAPELLPMDSEAIRELSMKLDLISLAVLRQTDTFARLQNLHKAGADLYREAWSSIFPVSTEVSSGNPKPDSASGRVQAEPRPGTTFQSIIRAKIASYESYNNISQALFLRNLQVYFARIPWPKSPEEGKAIRGIFQQSLVFFASDLLSGSSRIAKTRSHRLIELEDVRSFLDRILPHEVNDYEDVRYFPHLGPRSISIEAYDLDAFRDGGLHWRAIQWALEDEGDPISAEPDPFAAELIAEGVAQFGVLVLRVAGSEASAMGAPALTTDSINRALQKIQRLINEDSSTREHSETTENPTLISSNAGAPAPRDGNYFADITSRKGISMEHRSSDWLSRMIRSYTLQGEDVANLVIPPAFGGSGIAAEDLDGDGDADLLILSGTGNRLFRNEDGRLLDVTKDSGIAWRRSEDGLPGEVRQPLIADLDNDGLEDIVITYVNDDHRVYRNLGNFRFQDLTKRAGLGGHGKVGGPATILDYDLDGLPDIYIGNFGNYVKGILPTLARRNTNGTANQLFRNLGNFRFQEIRLGVEDTGWTQAVGHADINGDGWEDLISGNDFGVNHYYLNEGGKRFREISSALGTDKPSYTMNIGIADLNRDGSPDFYISNIVTMDKDQKYVLPSEGTRLKFDPDSMAHLRVLESNDLFISDKAVDGLPHYRLSDAVGRGRNSTGWAWDADFFDFDLDGDDDLYCVNGMNEFALYSSENPYYRAPDGSEKKVIVPVSDRESNVFFLNEGGRLENRSEESGTNFLGNSRSATYFDLEGDGDLDIALNNFQGPVRIYENRLRAENRHWLKIRLEGDPSRGISRDAIGAVVIVSTARHSGMWRQVSSTTGYLSVHPKTLHFGLGEDTEADIEVHWPGGVISRWKSIQADRLIRLSLPEEKNGEHAPDPTAIEIP